MTEFHRRIELQSPDDLQYLVSNIRRAADTEIEKNLPRMEGESTKDEMRDRVEVLVEEVCIWLLFTLLPTSQISFQLLPHYPTNRRGGEMYRTHTNLRKQYIQAILLAASENITINGLPASTSPILSDLLNGSSTSPNSGSRTANSRPAYKTLEEHEPFNTKSFAKIKDLATQEEDLIEEIARLRREMPHKILDGERTRWKNVEEKDEERLRVVDELGEDGGKGIVLEKGERVEELEGRWEEGVKGLERMVAGLPESVAKKERAERAEAYVVGSDRR